MTVFANMLEISAQAQGCKIIADFPDVCFTPPQTPATPPGVPIPYPNFAMDSDLASGSGTVKIGGKPISQENSSNFKKVSGDEAGCAPKKGIISSKNMGKAFAKMWSMDVKVEGKGVVRFTDIATTNHASDVGDAPPMPIVGKPAALASDTPDCLIGSYDDIVSKCNKRGGEAHHMVPDKCYRTGTRKQAEAGVTENRVSGAPSIGGGACICLSPKNHETIHEAERTAMDGIGKAGTEGLTGKKLDTKKAELKESGEWGTGTSKEVHDAAKGTLDDLDLSDDCKKKAKKSIDDQAAGIPPDQTLRTSNALPSPAAKAAMMND